MCGTVIGYYFSHESKAKFVRLLQNSSKIKPTVAVIGHGWSDTWMMDMADCSIELHN